MTDAEYRSGIHWDQDDIIDPDKLAQMVENSDYLKQHQVDMKYRAYNKVITSRLKICAGVTSMGPNKDRSFSKDIAFGQFFSPTCNPVVVASLAGPSPTAISLHTFNSSGNVLDNLGFRVHLQSVDKDDHSAYFPNVVYIHWIAIGW